jgi:group I intron endonuclease
MDRYGEVYLIINLINGKCYVGQTTKTLSLRFAAHKNNAKHARGTSPLHIAMREFGYNNFEIQPLAYCSSRTSLDTAEVLLIAAYNSLYPLGYNIRDGGFAHCHHSSTRLKLSQLLMGRKKSPEAIAASSMAQRGKKQTPETIAKRVAKLRGKKRARALGLTTKKIIDHNGVIYSSLTEAAELTGVGISAISSILHGRSRQAKGFVFYFYPKNNDPPRMGKNRVLLKSDKIESELPCHSKEPTP